MLNCNPRPFPASFEKVLRIRSGSANRLKGTVHHRCLANCQKQHRQNDQAGQVDVTTRVEVCVMGDPRHL